MERGNLSDTPGYRRGVVLGFTVAEIVLLILFALLLALAGSLVTGRAEVDRAVTINNVFREALEALEMNDLDKFKEELTKIVNQHTDYEAKLKDVEKRLKGRALPEDVYDRIQSENIDLSTSEGKKKLLDILIVALDAQRQIAESDTTVGKDDIVASCKTGADFRKEFGSRSVESVSNYARDVKGQSEHWRDVASKCGLGGTLPPCYRESVSDSIPFVFDVRIKSAGIVLSDTVPGKYRDRFDNNFQQPPPLNRPISESEFRAATYQFLEWGRRNECRFYVTVYDDLANDKDRLKSSLKAIESNFYKRITW